MKVYVVKNPQGNIIEYEIEENTILKNEENEFDWESIFV